jgi:hypothetical protein
MTTTAAPSALSALKALAKKQQAPAGSIASKLVTDTNDPAIAGAKRGKSKTTVTLGFDPSFAEKAKQAAELKAALTSAQAAFKALEGDVREYGAEKRGKYNSAFKCNLTTVEVPYFVDVPECEGSDTPGREQRVVQVICTNKYSVAQDTVLGLEDDLGPLFDQLFAKSEEKVLKPNAEELIRNLLGELGIQGEELDNSMDALFETKVSVSTTEDYERRIEGAPENVKSALEQAVVRQKPGLKFP